MRSPLVRTLLAACVLCALPFVARAAGRIEPADTGNPAPATGSGAGPGDTGKPAPADGPAGMVIVTDETLVSPFHRLADAHGRNGLVTRVRTLQSIRDAYPAGRDDAERIRMFLKDARASWGIEFALMGGDEPLIPMRRAYIDQLPLVLADTISLPTDQYYACLDGDWNADGDGRWGELPNPATGDPGDDADAIPELCVGRAPVTDTKQAQNFVDKTIHALEHQSRRDSLDVLLVAGGGLASGPGTHPIFVTVAENLMASIDPLTTATFTRLYRDENLGPGQEFLTRESALTAFERGPDLAFLLGFGGPGTFALDFEPRLGTLDAEDFLALKNQRSQGHVVALSGFTNVPGSLSVGAALIRADHGGCVSVLGATDLELIAVSTVYIQAYLQKGFADHVPTIGEAMRAALRDPAVPPTSNFIRLTSLGNTLLGDPALPFPAGIAPAAARAAAAGVDGAPGRALVTPNPARTMTEITFETSTPGAPLDVAVLDLAGRRVRTLESAAAPTGKRILPWDLRDDRGARVPSGLYFVKVSQGSRTKFTRVVVQ
jgi:hypothetical protein